MIKAIIFDIGGVVYKGKMEDFINKVQVFLRIQDNSFALLFDKYNNDLLLGKKSFFDLCDELKSRVSKEEFKSKVRQAWIDAFTVDEGIIDLINRLKHNFRVCCLSNATDFDMIMDKETGVDTLFDPYINSCEVNSKKPDKKIFQITLDKLNCKANECVYIDDREKYLQTPQEMGCNVLFYEDIQTLKEELVSLGIKVE